MKSYTFWNGIGDKQLELTSRTNRSSSLDFRPIILPKQKDRPQGSAFSFGAGDASYSELFWDVWDMIDRLYFAYQDSSNREKRELI